MLYKHVNSYMQLLTVKSNYFATINLLKKQKH